MADLLREAPDRILELARLTDLAGFIGKALADLDVTSPQFVVLTMIVAYPGVSGADLARLTFLTPQTVNLIVRKLERDKLVRRSEHETHGRVLRRGLP